jgi:hypothetical protein
MWPLLGRIKSLEKQKTNKLVMFYKKTLSVFQNLFLSTGISSEKACQVTTNDTADCVLANDYCVFKDDHACWYGGSTDICTYDYTSDCNLGYDYCIIDG